MGMIGRRPTVDIVMNGRKVGGLIDTGSEVTTVTERWMAENLQNSDLLPMTQVTLKAANRLEIPYSGVVIVDLELLGQKCEGVPVLVVKDSSDPSTRKKSDVPALVGMNVLGRLSSLLNNLDIVPPVLQPAVREIRLERTSVRGVARVAGQTHPSPFPRHPPYHRSAAAIKTPVGLTLSRTTPPRATPHSHPCERRCDTEVCAPR